MRRHRPVGLVAALVAGCVGCTAEAPAAVRAGAGHVREVVDGDTLRVDIAGTSTSVRLIGIDTPETHGRGGLRECFGVEAADRTAALLPAGTRVRLEGDAEARDDYGRLLAYVYRADDELFVNLTLAEEGYAAPLAIPPNVAHRADIEAAAAAARGGRLGLWGACGGADTPVRRVAPLPSGP